MTTDARFRLKAAGVLAAAVLVGGAVAAAAGMMRAEFTWTGAGVGDSYSEHCNWHPPTSCSLSAPFPDDPNDNAAFPWNGSGAWTVDLYSTLVSIGTLTLEGSTDFVVVGDTNQPTRITAATLLIVPAQGDIEITSDGIAEIKVPLP